jgi:hypothetical protein
VNKIQVSLQSYFLKILSILLVFIPVMGCGTSHLETIGMYMSGSGETIYMSTDQNYLRVFNMQKKRLIDIMKIPEKSSPAFPFQTSTIKTIFNFEEKVILQTANAIYEISNERQVKKIGETQSSLVSMDDQYFYLLARTFKDNKWHFKGSRLNRNSGEIVENHIDGEPKLIVSDILRDGQLFWYACSDFEKVTETFYGTTPVLVQKEISTGKTERMNLAPNIYMGSDMAMIDDHESLWLMSGWNIIKFKKSDRGVEIKKNPKIPGGGFGQQVLQHNMREETNYFWIISSGQITRINKETEEWISFKPPEKEGAIMGNIIFIDKKYVWAITRRGGEFASRSRRVVLKISKEDFSYEAIPINLGLEEDIKILNNLLFGLWFRT